MAGYPVEIVGPDGSKVQRFESVRRWTVLRTGPPDSGHPDAEPVVVDELLAEEHHRIYGRPWVLGRFYFDQLVRRELSPTDRVLDVGCGAGRVGVWLVSFLEAGRYCGLDAHLKSLVAFARYEAVLHRLEAKQPRLMLSSDFEVAGFGERFDVVLDFFVTRHLPRELAERALANARRVTAPGGRLFMSEPPPLGVDGMRALGFELTHTEKVSYPLLGDSPAGLQDVDHWHEFVAA